MEEYTLIRQINLVAIDTIHKRNIKPENYRNFTFYCNREIKNIIDKEIGKMKKKGLVSDMRDKIKKAAEECGGTFTMNGLHINFEVNDEYMFPVLVFDTYPSEL